MVRLKASEHRRPRGWQYTLHLAGYSTLKVGEGARQLRGASGHDDSAQDGQRVPQYTACKIGRSTHLAWLLVSGRSFGAQGSSRLMAWNPAFSGGILGPGTWPDGTVHDAWHVRPVSRLGEGPLILNPDDSRWPC